MTLNAIIQDAATVAYAITILAAILPAPVRAKLAPVMKVVDLIAANYGAAKNAEVKPD
jgi:hypothetical protein